MYFIVSYCIRSYKFVSYCVIFWCLGVKLVASLRICCMTLFSFAFYAAFTLLFKRQGSINLGFAQSDHRESISWHVLVPWPVPVPGSVCVPVALSRTGGNERALMLVPVTDAQHHHPSTSPPALSAFPSDTVRTGPSPDLQVAPLAGKVCQWSCPGSVNGTGCSWILAPLEWKKIGSRAVQLIIKTGKYRLLQFLNYFNNTVFLIFF